MKRRILVRIALRMHMIGRKHNDFCECKRCDFSFYIWKWAVDQLTVWNT